MFIMDISSLHSVPMQEVSCILQQGIKNRYESVCVSVGGCAVHRVSMFSCKGTLERHFNIGCGHIIKGLTSQYWHCQWPVKPSFFLWWILTVSPCLCFCTKLATLATNLATKQIRELMGKYVKLQKNNTVNHCKEFIVFNYV